ncbi:MAG TPA: hypothetical protein VH951_01275 [Dehalococcoidia bacterium]
MQSEHKAELAKAFHDLAELIRQSNGNARPGDAAQHGPFAHPEPVEGRPPITLKPAA